MATWPIPPAYLDPLQAAAYQVGIPRSWLAAVCDLAGWDPYFNLINVYGNGSTSVRRFGIAGIWARIPEVYWTGSWLNCWGGRYNYAVAGWFSGPWGHYGGGSDLVCGCGDPGGREQDIEKYRAVSDNMVRAARILKNCADIIASLCGEVNALAFVRWMWGCTWTPVDHITGAVDCEHLPPGIPDIFVREVDRLIDAQHFYAEKFGDDRIGVGFSVSISATKTVTVPGDPITFNANVSGGVPPYTFRWDFGDGTPRVDTANPSASHTYTDLGTYQATVTVYDNNLRSTISPPLTITIQATPPPGGGNLALWGLLGLLGMLGVAGLASRKSKRQQAAELRARAAQLRAAGKPQEAARLEAEATRLEQEAAREDVERAQRQMRPRE